MVFPKDVIFSGANLSKKENVGVTGTRQSTLKGNLFLFVYLKESYTPHTHNFGEQRGGHLIGKSENEKANTAV